MTYLKGFFDRNFINVLTKGDISRQFVRETHIDRWVPNGYCRRKPGNGARTSIIKCRR